MNRDVHDLTWPASKLGEAIEAIARTSGLSPRQVEAPNPAPSLTGGSDKAITRWVETTAGLLGLEAEPVETTYPEVESFVRGSSPALVPLPDKVERRYLALLGSKGRDVLILAPGLSTHKLRAKLVCDAMTADHEAKLEQGVESLLAKAGVARRRFERARAAVLRERLSQARIKCRLAFAPASGRELLATAPLRAAAAPPPPARRFVCASIFSRASRLVDTGQGRAWRSA